MVVTRQTWSKEIIVKTIRRLRKAKEKLNSNHIQIYRQTLYGAAVKYFGSWSKAIRAAGFNYGKIRVKPVFRSWNKKVIIRTILARKRRGLPINTLSVIDQDCALYVAAKRYFGKAGWSKALHCAGFNLKDLNPKRIWTKDKVLQEILKRWKTGQLLNTFHLQKTRQSSLLSKGREFFGSWQKAIEVAGLNYDKVRIKRMDWWNKKRVLVEIERLARQDVRLSSKAIHYSRGDLFGAAIMHFGGWGQAVEVAGIDYRQHLKTWSYKSWLRSLTSAKVKKLNQQAIKLAKQRRKQQWKQQEKS